MSLNLEFAAIGSATSVGDLAGWEVDCDLGYVTLPTLGDRGRALHLRFIEALVALVRLLDQTLGEAKRCFGALGPVPIPLAGR
mmetsp:Transcript_43682/g.57874  ORF Transcript_43682/g.57874 Transcript_43682/m.57874 type:complete len:83 (-) Transcript_43682:411-659(-)